MSEQDKIKKKTCFIITPIGNATDPIRRHIDGVIEAAITPVLKDNYEIITPHKLPNPGSINKQIIQNIYESDLVIANLTNNNPNVMYELAFRHCTGKPTVTIAEQGTVLPFDVSNERTIYYVNDYEGVIELKQKLNESVNSISSESYRLSNPIIDNMKDIADVTALLKKTDKSDTESDTFKYILDRLDKLQNSMTTNKPFAVYDTNEVNIVPEYSAYISLRDVNSDEEVIAKLKHIPGFLSQAKSIESAEIRLVDGIICIYIHCLVPLSRNIIAREIHQAFVKIGLDNNISSLRIDNS